jgi:acyl-CoA dehydrogenase
VREGDHYVVNGAKTFITSGVRADFVTTAVRTGGPGHSGVSLLVVEAGTPGFTVDRSLRKMGWHCSDTAELSYVDVHVPAATWSATRTAASTRSPSSSRSSGSRWPCTPTASPRGPGADGGVLPRPGDVRQAAHRQPGGAPQAGRDAPPGRGGADLHAVVAQRHVDGENVIAEACLAKQTACDAATYVCDQAVQLHGGTGYMHGTEVERHYRDARILPIGGGATEVLTDLAARLLGYTA